MMEKLKTDHPTLMRDLHAIYRHHDITPKGPALSKRSASKGPNSSRRALAKKLGIELPPIGAALMTLKVHELRAEGLSIPQIAKQLNRCEPVIRRHLKRAAPLHSTAAAAANSERAFIPSPQATLPHSHPLPVRRERAG